MLKNYKIFSWKSKKHTSPLAYSYYYFPVAILAIIGFLDSCYLAVSHYRNYADIGYQSFCAISKALNCDTVSQSPYSIFLDVPVPIWGMMGYGFFLVLLAFVWPNQTEKKRVWTLLLIISLSFSIYSIVLAFLSSYYIHSYCVMCIISYAVNMALLFYTWIIRRRFRCEPFLPAIQLDILYLLNYPKIALSISSGFATAALVMIFFFPPYWHMNPPELSKHISTGITKDGYPWIGSKKPELEIIEFSDYMCFQCKKMHYFLRRLIEENPSKIRLIHRQFPMDHTFNPIVTEPFHIGSAKLSLLAIFAAEQGKFWEMNDYLFDISRQVKEVNLRKLADNMNLDFDVMRHIFRDKRLLNLLWNDVKEGIRDYELDGTPGFVINGQMYLAQIPAEILRPYLK